MPVVLVCRGYADVAAELDEPESVAGLAVRREAGSIVLTWPSDPRERFVVLWRPEAALEARWIELTNQLPAAPLTNQTVFPDTSAFMRSPAMLTNANLAALYRVFLIPDVWFDLEGVELRGGPHCGEDFLPFYNGSKEVDSLFKPRVSLLVNGQEFSTEGSTPDFGTEELVERVNLGPPKKPHWAYARGFWFQHDTLPNGEYTLQLSTFLRLNLINGEHGQYLTITNKPVRVRINNAISFSDWQPFIQSDFYTFAARSKAPHVKWRIDVYDLNGEKVISKTGRTTNGVICWTWDLRDKKGRLRGDFEPDNGFRSTVTIWSPNQPATGAGALLANRRVRAVSDWWASRLGRAFVRKPPSEVDRCRRFMGMEPHPLESKALTRPLDLRPNR